MSLSSLIVQREVATIRQVEEALARQVIYGGDLLTNLLEVTRLEELTIIGLLSESTGLRSVLPGELPPPPDRVRSLVPADMAARHVMLPLDVFEGSLVVAVGEPLPQEVEEQLSFALGMPIEQRIAPTVRVREALSKAYSLPLDRRMQRILSQLSGDVTAPGSMPPLFSQPPAVAEPPRPRSEPRFRISPSRGVPRISMPSQRTTAPGFPAASVVPPPVEVRPVAPVAPVASGAPVEKPRSPYPSSYPAAYPATSASTFASTFPEADRLSLTPLPPDLGPRRSLVQRDPTPPPRPVKRRRGPLTLDIASQEADEATDRDILLDLFFEFARQYFDYTAIFLLHGDIAEGKDAFGTGAPREKVVGIGVPLDMPSLFATARERRRPVTAMPAKDGLDAVLMADLQRPIRGPVVVVPVVVRARPVAILFGDFGEGGADAGSAGEVASFAVSIGHAFERVIVQRKLSGFVAGTMAPTAGRVDPRKVGSKTPPRRNATPPPASSREDVGRAIEIARSVQIATPADPLAPPDPSPSPYGMQVAEAAVEPPHADPAPPVPVVPPVPALSPFGLGQPVEESWSPEPARIDEIPLQALDAEPPTDPSREPPPASPRAEAAAPESQPLEEPAPTEPTPSPFDVELSPMASSVDAPQPPYAPAQSDRQIPVVLPQVPPAPFPLAHSDPPPEVDPLPTPELSDTVVAFISGPEMDERSEPPHPVATTLAYPPPPPEVAVVRRPTGPPIPREEPDSQRSPSGRKIPSAPPDAHLEIVDVDDENADALVGEMSEGGPNPVPHVGHFVDREFAPPSQAIAVAPHLPPSSHEKRPPLPSVIVDMEREFEELVERLMLDGGDDAAEAELLRQGQSAMPAIMAQFPGPIALDRSRMDGEDGPRVSDCGPLLRLIAGQRRVALPFVITKLTDADAEQRYWATFLLTELHYPDAVPALMPRLFDSDARTRRVARVAARAIARRSPHIVIDELEKLLDTEEVDRKKLVVDALGELREPHAVPVLIGVLDPGRERAPKEIVNAAEAALKLVTREDFGTDARRWTAWWQANLNRHRIEWLIDALDNETTEVRRGAGEELKALTKEYFGFSHDLPSRERQRAQQRYRDWWITDGRSRFRRR